MTLKKEAALKLLQMYLETKDEYPLGEFNDIMNSLRRDGDFETGLQVYEEAIRLFPTDPLLYYNAAKVCKIWSEKLAGDYFDSKHALGMDVMEWMFGKGTPYKEFVELRHKAASYLEKVIELSSNLPSDIRDSIEEEIYIFRWS